VAFDGPGPFHGDPAFGLQMELEAAPEDAEAILEDAMAVACEQPYVEVDDGVWAWIAAELVARHTGHPSPDPLPEAFARVEVDDVSDLVPLARDALAAVADGERSELAQLWAEGYEQPFADRLADLRRRLGEQR
jgi:hypothetical protein